MSSAFDKAMKRFAKEGRIRSAQAIQEERDRILAKRKRRRDLANLLAEPYLSDLASRVLQKIREYGKAPELWGKDHYDLNFPKYWKFGSSRINKNSEGYTGSQSVFYLLESAGFVTNHPFSKSPHPYVPNPIQCALLSLEQAKIKFRQYGDDWVLNRSPEVSDWFDGSQTFVDPDSRIVYVITFVPQYLDNIDPLGDLEDLGYIRELGEYIARHFLD